MFSFAFKLRPAVGLLLTALVSGCTLTAVNRQPSEEELIRMAQSIPSEDDIKERFRAVGGVLREICTADEFAAYFAKSPCLATMATKRQLADKTRVTKKQAAAMQAALREIEELNAETRRMMQESQLEPYVSMARDAAEITDLLARDNQQKLLSGAITWGEYNRERQRIAQLVTGDREALRAVKQITDEVTDGSGPADRPAGQAAPTP